MKLTREEYNRLLQELDGLGRPKIQSKFDKIFGRCNTLYQFYTELATRLSTLENNNILTRLDALEKGSQNGPSHSQSLDSRARGVSPSASFGLAEAKQQGHIYNLPLDLTYYICGPMTGIEDSNLPAFDTCAELMRDFSYIVVNPADISRVIGPGHPRERYLRADHKALLDCTAILLLPGWEYSEGAFSEFCQARLLHLPIYYWHHVQ